MGMRFKIQLLLVFNGLVKRVSSVTKTCAVAASIFTMLLYTLTPSIAEVDKSSQPLVVSSMPANFPPNPDLWNRFIKSKSNAQKTLLVVSTVYSTNVVVMSSKKCKHQVHLCLL